MRLKHLILAVLALCLTCGLTNGAEKEPEAKPKPAIELGAPFSDNAILQRGMPVPVWGWEKTGAEITVEFAGQKKSATAGEDGKWMVKLDPLEASTEGRTMTVASSIGNRKLEIANILVGEVWMASGQSNMQWTTGKSSVGRYLMKEIAERVEAGKEKPPVIREAKVTNACSALHPIEHAEGEWSTTAGNFSAIAYAFAYEIHKEVKVPVGILNCAFSTTSIQAWVPRVGFADSKVKYTQGIYKEILESDPSTPEHNAAWDAYYKSLEETIAKNADLVKKGLPPQPISTRTPGNLQGNRDASWMYNAKIHPMVPYAIRGCIWNQGYASQGDGYDYYHNLHSLVGGWRKVWNRPDLPVYFNQFYTAGNGDDGLSLTNTAEMRLGTWKAAQDIPNAGMASQIDIGGGIHYFSKVMPGRRLAYHALKNQYPSAELRAGGKAANIVTDGPMFKSYQVDGNQLIVEFDHAEGGLVVAETGTQAKKGIALPTVIENGEDQVTLFYIADANRVWHRAKLKIAGDKVILTAPGVSEPKGVAYACNGVSWLPNLYNKALLPMTPFIYYDNKMVLSTNWPDQPIKVNGVEPDPTTVGKLYEYRRMPILSTQFRDNAVLQAGMPITFWGSAVHDWGYEAKGKAVIRFNFAGIEKAIPVTPGMKKWSHTVPAMEASAEPKSLKVTLEIDGEIAHVREARNIVIGDVWYVAAPPLQQRSKKDSKKDAEEPVGNVRMMRRKAKRFAFHRPSPYSVCVSTTPKNRFACLWEGASGFAEALGERIAGKTGKPVGVIFMQSGTSGKPAVNEIELRHWISRACLKNAPSLMEDYKDLAAVCPGTPYYDANVRRYIGDWKKYWGEYIPQMIATKRIPDGSAWGRYPSFSGSVTSKASQVFNVMVNSFGPASLKGIIFISSEKMVEKEQGAHFGSELSALANCWKDHFAAHVGQGDAPKTDHDPHFFYTVPTTDLAPKVTRPESINGKSTGVEITKWEDLSALLDTVMKAAYK